MSDPAPAPIPAAHRAGSLDWVEVGPDGLPADRQAVRLLDELRRPLPLEPELCLDAGRWSFRSFRPGADDAALLSVNNRAFDWHADQGGWTADDLAERLGADWFTPDDVVVHDAGALEDRGGDGRPPAAAGGGIDGFCWTRFHPAADDEPARGEIFAIATDPGRHGRGLGRALAIAGLARQAERGAVVATLFVEHDNAPAQRLYETLGFRLHRQQAGLLRSPEGRPGSPGAAG